MRKPKPRPWTENWEDLGDLGSGGLGQTKRVRSKRDGTIAALKILKSNKDPERRARMHREAEALRTLAHAGIPKLLESNTEAFEGTDRLFMVLELIEGPTLEKRAQSQVLSFDEAVVLTSL